LAGTKRIVCGIQFDDDAQPMRRQNRCCSSVERFGRVGLSGLSGWRERNGDWKMHPADHAFEWQSRDVIMAVGGFAVCVQPRNSLLLINTLLACDMIINFFIP
jgi:hypothetical protein